MSGSTTTIAESRTSATGEALSRIVTGVREIYTKVGDMASEGSRQSTAGENIAERIKSLSINSMEAVAGVEQIAQAVVDLHAQAKQLRALAERFSTQNDQNRN